MRASALACAVLFASVPAEARQERLWIEKVSIIAVGQGMCGRPLDDPGMQMAIGSAMISYAMNKDTVIERARKRARFISNDIVKQKTLNTFCQAFRYYLDKGYPR